MSVEPRLTFSLVEASRRKAKEGAARTYRAVMKREKPLGPTKYHFGCDIKKNTDTRLVVAFPVSPVLTPELAVGQPGQIARFEFSKRTKKDKHHHGRRADVIFVA